MRAYIYKADLHCHFCTCKIKGALYQEHIPRFAPVNSGINWEDSDNFPQGPYDNGGGEADSPQHCGTCGVFLENPLTEDGEMYVLEQYENVPNKGNREVVNQWIEFYDYLDLAEIGEGPY